MKEYINNPLLLAQRLIQFNTTNGIYPEKPCIDFIRELLESEGIETKTVSRDANRPNLFAKIPSKQNTNIPPLLFAGHVDVVSTESQKWDVDPFAGIVKNGYLWGRGAMDMKGEMAMFISVMLKVKTENIDLPFDLCLMAVSDEEGNSEYGMKYLVNNHPELFEGLKFALGEIGGFSLRVSGKKLYPIMIGEKQFVRIKITTKSKGGHASMARGENAMTKMAKVIGSISNKKMPVRITEEVTLMISEMAKALGGVSKFGLNRLLNKGLTNTMLKALGENGALFDPLLHNTATVTIIKGGEAINVVPSEVVAQVDMRMVPGCTIEEGLKDLRKIIGHEPEVEVMVFDKGSSGVDMTLYNGLKRAIIKKDPAALPVPFVLAGVTDGRFLSKVGIQTYGFTPMDLPTEYDFIDMAHNKNEKVPEDAIAFGTEVLLDYVINDFKESFNG